MRLVSTVWPDILAGIMFGGLLEKGKNAFGGYGTIATPSPVVYAVGAILADLILAV